MLIDETLVVSMKAGEESAFSDCYQKLSPYVYSVILRICGRPAIAEEIMQDSFIQAFSSLDKLQKNTHFYGWIKRIAFNKTLNHLRQQKDTLEISDEHCDEAMVFDKTIMQESQLAYLMGHLPSEAKMIIWLFIVEGYSHKEIAGITGKTQSYSKSLVSRNLEKLRVKNLGVEYAL